MFDSFSFADFRTDHVVFALIVKSNIPIEAPAPYLRSLGYRGKAVVGATRLANFRPDSTVTARSPCCRSQ